MWTVTVHFVCAFICLAFLLARDTASLSGTQRPDFPPATSPNRLWSI